MTKPKVNPKVRFNLPLAVRIATKSVPEPNTGCHLWTGEINASGYGRLSVKHRGYAAHRLAYELAKGPIPEGLQLDHLCRVRCCVNPDHLEAVTRKENILRGIAPSAQHARKTHCKHGHPFDEANTYRFPQGWRMCRTCERAKHRAMTRRRALARMQEAARASGSGAVAR